MITSRSQIICVIIAVVCSLSIIGVLTFPHNKYTMQRRQLAVIPVESKPQSSHNTRIQTTKRKQPTDQPDADEPVTANPADYFRGVLDQFRDDSSILDPMHIGAAREAAAAGSVSPYADLPFGHSAIEEVRIDLDTLGLVAAYNGYTNGEVTYQLNEINNVSSPIRVVQITISPFLFPRVYLAVLPTYEYFYLHRVYMWLQFIPMLSHVQTLSSNTLFTYELAVDIVDNQFVQLTPLLPTITLKQPINLPGALIIKYFNRNPAGISGIPIPPTRLFVRRDATIGAVTKFALRLASVTDPLATALGPAGPVTVRFSRTTADPITPLEQLLDGQIVVANNFMMRVVGPPPLIIDYLFDVPIDTTSVLPVLQEPIFANIPKNTFGVTMHFLSLNPAQTNDLIPVSH